MDEKAKSKINRGLKVAPALIFVLMDLTSWTALQNHAIGYKILNGLSLLVLISLALKGENSKVGSGTAWMYFIFWVAMGMSQLPGSPFTGDDSIFSFFSWCTSFLPNWQPVSISGAGGINFYLFSFLAIPFIFTMASLEKDPNSEVTAGKILSNTFLRIFIGFLTLFALFFAIWLVDAISSILSHHPLKSPKRWFIFVRYVR